MGAHDMGLMNGKMNATQMLDASGAEVRAIYMAGSFPAEHLRGREEALGRLDFLVVQELLRLTPQPSLTSYCPPHRSLRSMALTRTMTGLCSVFASRFRR
jgi:hypothetical protein